MSSKLEFKGIKDLKDLKGFLNLKNLIFET
jgi:hypothetical protein